MPRLYNVFTPSGTGTSTYTLGITTGTTTGIAAGTGIGIADSLVGANLTSGPIAGYWLIDPPNRAVMFPMYKKPRADQIQNVEELLSWKWVDA